MNNVKVWSLMLAAFISGAFIASSDLRAFAANTIGSSDIINESILSQDIKNGQVKAADIAANAVGASELQGVTKLVFSECFISVTATMSHGQAFTAACAVEESAEQDKAIVTRETGDFCFAITKVDAKNLEVHITMANVCEPDHVVGEHTFSVILYKPG
jgi:hypothetical protein